VQLHALPECPYAASKEQQAAIKLLAPSRRGTVSDISYGYPLHSRIVVYVVSSDCGDCIISYTSLLYNQRPLQVSITDEKVIQEIQGKNKHRQSQPMFQVSDSNLIGKYEC